MFIDELHHGKGTQVSFDEEVIFPALSAEKLLSGESHQAALVHIRQLTGLSEDAFERLYQPLIYRYAEFVQCLPSDELHSLGGLLNQGLERAYTALKLAEERGTVDQEQFTYAIFSAALLKNCAKMCSNIRIHLVDEKGFFQLAWLPHLKPINACGDYFSIRYVNCDPPQLESAITPILAKHIMPEEGYAWLAQDQTLLTQWITVLSETEDTGGTLGTQLNLVLQLIKQKQDAYFSELGFEIHLEQATETAVGRAFLKWLREGLESGEIPINEEGADVHSVKKGLLLNYEKLFADFKQSYYSKHIHWIVAYQQFNHLGLTKKSGHDYKFEQYFSEYPVVKGQKGEQSAAQHGMFSRGAPPKQQKQTATASKAFALSSLSSQTLKNTPQKKAIKGVVVTQEMLFKYGGFPEMTPYVHAQTETSEADEYLEHAKKIKPNLGWVT